METTDRACVKCQHEGTGDGECRECPDDICDCNEGCEHLRKQHAELFPVDESEQDELRERAVTAEELKRLEELVANSPEVPPGTPAHLDPGARAPRTEKETLIIVEQVLADTIQENLEAAQQELLDLKGIDHADCTTLIRVLRKMLVGMRMELRALEKTGEKAPRIQVVSSMPKSVKP